MASVRDNKIYKTIFDTVFGEDSEASLRLCELARKLEEKDAEIVRLTGELNKLIGEQKDAAAAQNKTHETR